MKSVTCFTANLTGGGAEHQLSILSNLLADEGYDVTIVTYNNLPDHYILNKRIKRVRLNVDGKSSIVKQWIISNFFWKHHTDCIISYRSVPNFILLIPMMLKRRPKIIVSERNTTVKPLWQEKINYSFLYNRAAYIVPNSHTQANYLMGLNRKWKNRIVTITNYTDICEFSIKSIPEETGCIRIGVISRIFPQKNYVRFCEMLCELKKRTSKKFRVIWFGDKKEGVYLKGSIHIHRLIDEKGLSDVLEVRDAITDVSAIMHDFHAMCLPSLYEGFSNAISEYICSGKVVLCSNVSDNSLMVKDGVNGYLFNPQDVNSMCDAFIKFLELSKDEILRMGYSSRQIAEKLFDKEVFVKSYVELIES